MIPPPNLEQGPDAGVAVPLQHLQPGQSARISRLVGHPDHVHRLREFGLCDGVRVEMFRRGNPCIIRLAGNKVCLRADELLDVFVVPAAEAAIREMLTQQSTLTVALVGNPNTGKSTLFTPWSACISTWETIPA